MQRTAMTIVAIVALAACNREPQVSATNASVAEVAEKVRKAGAGESFVRPGLWESKVTIEQLDVPGMPAEMAGKMKSMMAERQMNASRHCLTAEDVKKPKEDLFAGQNKSCRYDRFNMGGGKMDAVMRCGDKNASQVMEMSGTYSPDAYQMRMANKVDVAAKGAEGAMAMKMRVDARRIGECTGKEG
ncbi:MAG: DUF3617 domain-containing protein [Sphingomicrobium sp.]